MWFFYFITIIYMARESKGCFIIPYWRTEKDDKCLSDLIDSAYQHNMLESIFFIVDDEETSNYVKSLLDSYYYQKDSNIIIVDNPEELYGKKRNVPTIKKFYGIKQVYNEYEFIAAIDVDSLFLKGFNPFFTFFEIWNSKTCFFKNRCDSANSVFLKNASYFCGLENNFFLKKETDNFTLSCWFNDIPVYKSSTLDGFFNWIENTKTSNDKTIYENIRDNFTCYDYWIYWYYMICFKGLTSNFIEKSSLNSIIESIIDDYTEVRAIDFTIECDNEELSKDILKNNRKFLLNQILEKEKIVDTHWTPRDYKYTKDDCPNTKLCLQIHTDRINNKKRKTALEPFWYKIND